MLEGGTPGPDPAEPTEMKQFYRRPESGMGTDGVRGEVGN